LDLEHNQGLVLVWRRTLSVPGNRRPAGWGLRNWQGTVVSTSGRCWTR